MPLAFFNLGPQEMLIILIFGVILFGRRLPEVGRYLGKGIVEFKKGLKGIEDDDFTANAPPPEPPRPPQRVQPSVPKFQPGPQGTQSSPASAPQSTSTPG